jgi:S-(hydroxymethyl)glutathione dehydrogenase/alcohol dehydrogenase
VGSTQAAEQALSLVKRQGTVVLVGLPHSGATFAFPMGPCVFDEWRIMGSNMGSTRLSVDIPRLVDLYLSGRLKLDELITAR